MPNAAESPSAVSRPLEMDRYPMRLWAKAKRLGTWDPAAIDLLQDRADWQQMSDREQDLLLRLTTQFMGGEESVTHDLLPLLHWTGAQGWIEDEMFLTSYLWEEAKHVEAFHRLVQDVMTPPTDPSQYFTTAYETLFFEELPAAMEALHDDPSPATVARAAVTYQIIVEGVLAETGYTAYYSVLDTHDLMPGVRAIVRNIQQDESRHIGYGVYLLSRLLATHGTPVRAAIDERLEALLPLIIDHITATLAPYGDDVPFGISAEAFVDIGMAQFEKRAARLNVAEEKSLDEIVYAREASAPTDAGTVAATLPSTEEEAKRNA